jgi:hypothetical protein
MTGYRLLESYSFNVAEIRLNATARHRASRQNTKYGKDLRCKRLAAKA